MLDRVTTSRARAAVHPRHRFTVAHLIRLAVTGWDLEQIQGEFPFIDAEDVQQALVYAAECAEVTTLRP